MRKYLWRDGDTPDGVAMRLGLTARAIRAANPTLDFSRLVNGCEIVLPQPGVSCPSCAVYAVKRGQSVSAIARSAGVNVVSLMNANPYVDPSALVEGEVLVIPEREFCFCRYRDSLADVARREGIPLSEVRKHNPSLADRRMLPPGARVRLTR